MKRILTLLTAAMLVFSVAGTSSAYFEDLELISSIYNLDGSYEVGVDLGVDVTTLSTLSNEIVSLVDLSTFDGGLESLNIAYWAHDQANTDYYATGYADDGDGLTMYARKTSVANEVYNTTQDLYGDAGTASALFTDKTVLGTYWMRFEVNGNNIGSMYSCLTETEMTESLAELLTVGYVDQILYLFDYDNSTTGVQVATIRTFLTSDGQTIDLNGTMLATVINPVPIPAGLLLLGSGLLGLVGIRRRKT